MHHLPIRQLKSHNEQMAGSCSVVEICRRHLHICTLIAAAISIIYFILVLGGALRWCTAVLSLMMAPAYIGGSILAARMWVYT